MEVCFCVLLWGGGGPHLVLAELKRVIGRMYCSRLMGLSFLLGGFLVLGCWLVFVW